MTTARPTPAPLLALRGVSRSFGARRALVDVTLAIGAGEVVLLVGANGAGKTTLLRIATGFLDPDAGEVEVGGVAIAGPDVGDAGARGRAAGQAKLGYLPEHAPAPAELSVRDHLRLRARLKGLGGGADAAVARALAATATDEVAARRIGTLSKGFRQRVGLADALLGEPALLVLDEPTSGMDPIQVRQLRAQLAAIAPGSSARGVLVSSHAVTDLAPLAARIAVLRAGELVADDTADALCARTGEARLEDAIVALLGPTGADDAPRAPNDEPRALGAS